MSEIENSYQKTYLFYYRTGNVKNQNHLKLNLKHFQSWKGFPHVFSKFGSDIDGYGVLK